MKAVLFAPHNDDETLFASYLILRYRPKVIVCLRSERMHQPGYPGGPLGISALEREEETLAALRELGLTNDDYVQWDYGDADPDWDEMLDRLTLLARDAELVIYPAQEEGGNEQHNWISTMVEHVIPSVAGDPEKRQQRIRFTTYTAEGRSRRGTGIAFEPDWPARKLRALACYGSQIAHPATAAHFLDGGLREYVA